MKESIETTGRLDANRFRWIERHKPLMEYTEKADLGWVVSLENGAESGLTLRTAIDKAMRATKDIE